MHIHSEIEIETETATGPIGLSTEPEDLMHASTPTQLINPSQSNSQTRSPAMTDVTTTTQTAPIHPVLRRRSRELIAFDHAKRELKWAFAAKHSGNALDAAAVQARGDLAVLRLLGDASYRYDRAVWKYVKVRGCGPCVVPVRKRAPRAMPAVAEAPTPTTVLADERERVPDTPIGPRSRSDLRLEVAHAL
jgi:hypothetical protein